MLAEFPNTLIKTSGPAVGLPEGQMGNSEVGHLNMGAGRIVHMDITRIDQAIGDGSFFKNDLLLGAMESGRQHQLHLLGLVSDDVLFDLAAAVQSGSAAEIFRLIDQAVSAGKDPRQLLYDLTEHFRELLLSAAGAVVPGDERGARVREQATSFGLPRLLSAVEMLATGEKELRWSQQSRLLVEVLLARLAQPSTAAAAPAPGSIAPGTAAAPGGNPRNTSPARPPWSPECGSR